MDDEDGLGSPGLSGWAGFQLGRMAAERDRHTSETVAALFGRRRPAVNVNAVLAHNQALAAENAQLRRDLEAFRHNYNKLNAWAEEAERDLKRFRSQ